MKIAILGAGNTGKGYAAWLTQAGHEVVLYNRTDSRLSPIRENGLTVSGKISGNYSISVTDNLREAIKGCHLILVCTVANGHRPLAAGLRGLLEPNTDIVITNGCWGAVEFDLELGEEAEKKSCTISETGGQLLLCSSPAPDSVFLKTIKQQVSLACTRPADTEKALERLRPLFPQFQPASNVLYTSLNSSNPLCHGPLVLFNLARLENGEDYLLFGTCATPRVVRLMEKIDAERVQVVRACRVEAPSLLELLNSYWPDKQENLYDVFHRTPSYSVSKGPKTLDHRYLTEDLPYGLVPYVRLGKKFGIPTPCLSALLEMFCLYMDMDYLSQGPEVETIELGRFL